MISGKDSATTDIIKASAVPTPTPFRISASTIGMVPTAFEYSGIPVTTATRTTAAATSCRAGPEPAAGS